MPFPRYKFREFRMQDATATIESAEDTTVYMVDFEPTTGEEMVRNHKWVTEAELSPN